MLRSIDPSFAPKQLMSVFVPLTFFFLKAYRPTLSSGTRLPQPSETFSLFSMTTLAPVFFGSLAPTHMRPSQPTRLTLLRKILLICWWLITFTTLIQSRGGLPSGAFGMPTKSSKTVSFSAKLFLMLWTIFAFDEIFVIEECEKNVKKRMFPVYMYSH